MQPPPPSSIHLRPAHFNLHLVSSTSTQTENWHHFDWKLVLKVSWRCWYRIWTYIFEIPTSKFIFGQICTKKAKVLHIDWKLAHRVSRGFWFTRFSISNPKSISGQTWAKDFKVVHFVWKLAHIAYRGCWFLFCHQFFEFPNLNPFLGRVRSSKWNCLFGLM